MHSVEQSATIGLRERRRQATRLRLTTAARALTAEHGLSGFTVEQLCEQVGVSRRTFFNYFPTKEDAVVGHGDDSLDDDVVAWFVAGGGAPGEPSAGLLDDLVALTAAEIERIAVTADELAAFIAATTTEPDVLRRFMNSGAALDRRLVALVEEREGLRAGDPRAEAAVLTVSALMRRACERFFAPDNASPFRELAADSLAAARAVYRA